MGNENFLLWRSSMSRDLKARNKLGFVDRTLTKEIIEQTKTLKCERANVFV